MSKSVHLVLLVGLAFTSASALAAPPFHIQSLVIRDGVLWAGTFGKGLLRSTDAGVTWVPIPLPKDATSRVLAVVWDGSALLAGTESTGLWLSTTDGASWSREDAIPSSASIEGVCVASDGAVWAGTWDDGLFRRSRGAWAHVEGWKSAAGGPVLASVGERVFVGTLGDGLYFSDDQGASWGKAAGTPEQLNVAAITAAPSQALFLASVEGAVFRSTDRGASWSPVSKCVPEGAAVYQLTWSPDGLWASSSQGIHVSRDGGAHWDLVPSAGSPPAGHVVWVDASDVARHLPTPKSLEPKGE